MKKSNVKPLRERHRLFVEAYAGEAKGNGAEAARMAGFKGSDKVLATRASETLQRPEVQAALAELVEGDPLVANGEEIRRFWTSTMRGEEVKQLVEGQVVEAPPPVSERLKAAKDLARASGMFIDRKEVSVTGGVVVFIPDNGRGDGNAKLVLPLRAEDA